MKSFSLLLLLVASACSSSEESSSTSLTQLPGECGEIETHVIGIYETPDGDVTLRIDRPGRHALILSAYMPTTWNVTTGPGAQVEAIYAVGYHRQTVKAETGIKVVTDSHDDGGPYACGYSWPSNDPSCDTDQLLRLTGKVINHDATSYHGCYDASSWHMGEDLAVTSNCGTEQSDFVANCNGPDSCGGPILL
jgi:hypothetical protein